MDELADVIIEDERWETLGLEDISNIAIRAALDVAGVTHDGFEVCVMGCDDRRIAELNAEFREKPVPTNVLSWPAFDLAPQDPGGLPVPPPGATVMAESLGDIAIAYETCLREAEDKRIDIRNHVTHLVIHGCLHLLGYDHETDSDADIMESLEIKALATLGISNPY